MTISHKIQVVVLLWLWVIVLRLLIPEVIKVLREVFGKEKELAHIEKGANPTKENIPVFQYNTENSVGQ